MECVRPCLSSQLSCVGPMQTEETNMVIPKNLQLQQFSGRSGVLSDRNRGMPIFLAMTVVLMVKVRVRG